MLDLGRFPAGAIAAIANGAEQRFVYEGTVQRDTDSTLAYIGGGWVDGLRVLAVTQSEYDGLTSPDAGTLYVIS